MREKYGAPSASIIEDTSDVGGRCTAGVAFNDIPRLAGAAALQETPHLHTNAFEKP